MNPDPIAEMASLIDRHKAACDASDEADNRAHIAIGMELSRAAVRHLPALLEIARAAREVDRWGAQGLNSSGDEALMELRQALAALATGEGKA